jgi:hypothetical protein
MKNYKELLVLPVKTDRLQSDSSRSTEART